VHKVRKKTLSFLLCTEVQQIFSFPFSLLKRYQMPECFYVNNCYFELVQLLHHVTEIGNVYSQCRQRTNAAWATDNCLGYSELSRNTNLKNALWMKGLQKVVRWFLDAGDNPETLIITGTFCPIYKVPWNLHTNPFRGICIKLTNYQAKSMRKQLIYFAQSIITYQTQGFFNPNQPPLVDCAGFCVRIILLIVYLFESV